MPSKYVPVTHLRKYEHNDKIVWCGRKTKPKLYPENIEDKYYERDRFPANTCGSCLRCYWR